MTSPTPYPVNGTESPFLGLLHQQIGNEFTSSQQYIAVAIFYDNHDLPQLARYFYRHSVEERNHAMMIIQYFLDRDLEVEVPGIPPVRNKFADHREPLVLALNQEKTVTEQIIALAKAARDEGDYLGEQYMQWFLKEQVEEVAGMTTLLTVCDRAKGNLFDLEAFVAREFPPTTGVDSAAPTAAGGNL